ncbi:MAG: hypothetical protein KZQ94_21640, partial [Candidatus Thiodiazotropha sp. (ex Troendleina suluensis)]|nr:hypothetical protein [Candidatus Thiodiazotropha sp. (ex Troendleina suluensis)]
MSFLLRQKKRHQKKGRPAVTPLGGALRCSAKPAGLKLAALKQSGPLDRFRLRFSLATGRDSKKAGSYTEHDSKANGFFAACLRKKKSAYPANSHYLTSQQQLHTT